MASKQGTCVSCGRVLSIVARGLCGACYSKDRQKTQSPAAQRKTGVDKLFENDMDLLESITKSAQENYRSVNGEILYRLRNYQGHIAQ